MTHSRTSSPIVLPGKAGSSIDFTERAVQAAVQDGLLSEENIIAAFVNTDGVAQTIQSLKQAFPDSFRHAFAAKANTMSHALRLVKESGLGCEASSPGELHQALAVGFEPENIVYDEPAKTKAIIRKTLHRGVCLNIDNFQEFEFISSIMNESGADSRIGFRINPQVGAGSIGPMSTATKSSKFGIALDDAGNRGKLIDYHKASPWLTGMHTHIGSQGCTLDLMVAGIAKVVELAIEINAAVGKPQIEVFDIGGGLPVNFDSDEIKPTFEDYANKLQREVPDLFNGQFVVKTEFGRSIYAKNGIIVARVEYTKESGGNQIAVCHAGAQTAARTVFMPEFWKIRLSVFDANGVRKSGNEVVQDVAGPCCFAGDMLAYQCMLPLIEPGDHIVLHDTGAYYFSNPFIYNSLPAHAVYGASCDVDGRVDFDVWRRGQTIEELLAVLG